MSAKTTSETKGWIFLAALFVVAMLFTQLKTLFG